MKEPLVILISAAALMFIVIGGLSLIAHFYTLNGIKSKTVGDGQHGVARFLTRKENTSEIEKIIATLLTKLALLWVVIAPCTLKRL